FFDLSRADYLVMGNVSENSIEYEVKISTTFETVDQGVAEGAIPFHTASVIGQRIRNKLEVKDAKVISLEQIFHGNLGLLQQYSLGVHAYREGLYRDAEHSFRLALNHEPSFAPAHLYLARALENRGLHRMALPEAEAALLQSSQLPSIEAAQLKAKYYAIQGKHQDSAHIYKIFHEQFPNVIEYLLFWGEELVKADQLEEAANAFYEICEKEAKSGLGWQRLAAIETLQEKYEQAWYHYKRAERLYSAREHIGGMAACYMGLADIAEKRNEWSTAIDYHHRAGEGFTKLKWRRGMGQTRYRMGQALKKQNLRSDVPRMLKEAIKYFHQTGDMRGESQCLSEILSEPLSLEEAKVLSDRALTIAGKMQDDLRVALFVPFKLR